LESGQIDVYPGYAATDLEFYNKGAGEANADATATTTKLNSHLAPLGLVALDPSAAVDQNAFAVTKATQTKFSLTKLSDLAPIGSQLTLGAGPECPTRPFCQPGLTNTYGITFKVLNAIDAKLTTADLVTLNSQVSIQHQDADAVATAWLQQHNYAS